MHAAPVALVTGAARGLGLEVARQLAAKGLTSTLAAELSTDGILVNALCPDLTATYPGAEQMGARPAVESARGVVWAATLPDDGPSGGFFRDGLPLPW